MVITLAMCAGNLVQFALGALGPVLIDDLGLSRVQFGALTSTYYAVGVLLSPRMGRLVDHVGGRPLLLVMFAASSVALAAMASAPTYALLLAAVGLAAVALALSNPVTNQLVATHVRRGEQGVLMGVKQSGVQVGAFIAGFLLPGGALLLGWRGVLLVSAVLGVVGVALTFGTIPAAGERRGRLRGAGHGPLPRLVWWLTAYALLMGAGLAALITYMPLYAHEALGMGIPAAGATVGLMGVTGIPARILWARSAERRESMAGPLLVIAVASVGCLALLILGGVGPAFLVWIAAVGFGASCAAWNAVGMLAVVRDVDSRMSGRASGVVLSGFYVGLVVSPAVFGLSVDATSSYRPGWLGIGVVFALSVACAGLWRRSHANVGSR